jgi:predicted enzyme involved in methoxymalonyl-ACP biosynthesis
MSCRVFSRTAEQFILNHLVCLARQRGARRIVGEYQPTRKNGVVADLYKRLGFVTDAAGDKFWVLDLRHDLPALTSYVQPAES